MSKLYRPSRLDHFPNSSRRPQNTDRWGHAKEGFPGSGDTLKMWLEAHNLPISKHPEDNQRSMIRATGGRA